MEQQTYSDISTLEQAELAIRRKGIVHDEKVEGRQLLELCGFAKIDNTTIKRQIEKHAFIEGKDFMPSMAESSGGRPKTVYHFLLNAANHILLSAMTVEGKKARQEAIDDKLKKQHLQQDSVQMLNAQITPQTLLEANMATSLKAIAFAEAMGFTGNQKLISADRLLKSQIGFSPLEAMGQKKLLAPVQAITFTPTQLGQMMAPFQEPRQVNKLLEAAGLQIKVEKQWVPTDQGQPYCEILDTGKSHNIGTPVKQVKWFQSVLEFLNTVSPGESKDETNVSNLVQSKAIGDETDIEPIHRKQKRKRNRYALDDYFSLVELGEFIGQSRQHVVEVLEKHRLIKWTGQGKRGKFLLTDKGWQYGMMYDPSEQTFHNKNSKRLTTSNAQPVLGYEILKFFK